MLEKISIVVSHGVGNNIDFPTSGITGFLLRFQPLNIFTAILQQPQKK